MLSLLSTSKVDASGLLSSSLFDETTFYTAFIRDLNRCTSEAIIESPFMTGNRVASLLPIFSKMIIYRQTACDLRKRQHFGFIFQHYKTLITSLYVVKMPVNLG